MSQTHRAIGILGGTFDPIHFGHLRMAIELYEVLDLANVHIIPCYQPVHRKRPAASAKDRLAMVAAAAKNEPALIVDDREIRRGGPSFMIDTLREMRKEMPDTPLCIIVGIDAFLGFPSWNKWQEILQEAHIVIAHRPQYHLPTTGIIAEIIHQHLQSDSSFIHENMAGGILFRPITALDISATEIRKLIAMGRNPRYLLPKRVYTYIQQHHIYSISRI